MALDWCTYEVDFENFVQGHKLDAGENRNEKVDFVLVEPLYNVRSDQNANALKYDIVISEDWGTGRRC